jgi:hypothetical protein
MSTLQNTDVFPVARGTTTYKVTYSDMKAGTTQIATAAEVVAGTINTKAVSPKGVKDNYIAKNVATLPLLP